jgi:uncharacterized YccA/Bax inhibitor family protein
MLNERTFSQENVQKVEPSASPAARRGGAPPVVRTMSYGGTIVKSMFLLALTIAFATLGWRWAAKVQVTSGLWFFLGYMLLIALSIAAVGNPRLAMWAGILYAVLMGLWMGSISRIYEAYYEGIVGQAVLASVCVFAACLFLYSVRAIRVTGRFVRFVLIATLAIGFMYLVGWLLSLFGIRLNFLYDGSTVGVGISLFVVLIAAFNLILDFAIIDAGVTHGAPKAFEWYCAFGLLSTLVWLYLEILRLLARTRQ